MTKEKLVEKFVSKPSYILKGAGHIAKQTKSNLEDVRQAKEEARIILNMPRKNTVDAYKQKLDTLNLQATDVKSVKFWDNMQGEQRFSIQTKNEWYKKEERDEYFENLKAHLTKNITPVKIVKTPSNKKALMIHTSDKHIGCKVVNSIYENEYNEGTVEQRMEALFKEVVYLTSVYGKFDAIYFNDLGDALDGYNGQTTRGGHRLPQNMDNQQQFDTFVKTTCDFFDKIVAADLANNYHYTCVNNDNHCFTEDTEILTDSGWKYYTELDKSDKVGTMNLETEGIEFQLPIDYIFNEKNTEPIEYYKNRYVDLSVTNEHRILCKKMKFEKKSEKFEFHLSKNLIEGNVRFKISGKNNNSDNLKYSDAFIQLAAWIATDGSVIKNKENIPTAYLFYQREEKVHLIEDLLKKENITYLRVLKGGKAITEICGKKLKNIPKPMYVLTVNKKNSGEDTITKFKLNIPDKYNLPSWLFSLSKRQFDLYLKSFIDGDGTRKKGVTDSATIYGIKEVLDQIQILCIINGHRANIEQYREKDYRLNVSFNREEVDIKIKHRKTIINDYTGYTWCVTVPNSNVIIRKGGKPSIQGNSGDFAYCANRAIQIYLNCRYPQVNVRLMTKFIEHYTYGNHTFMLCHGKDKEDMKHGMPLKINPKVENYILQYIEYHNLKGKLHFIKGDLHTSNTELLRKFRYVNVLSLFGASKWIHNNFGNSNSGVSFDVIEKHTDRVMEYKLVF